MTNVKNLITEYLDIWLTAETEKKSGRGRSSDLSNSIYGVQKLRELILDLAFQGKLLNSVHIKEPIDVRNFKEEINKNKKNFHNKYYPKFKFNKVIEDIIEEPYKIPQHWIWFRLPDITCYKTGKTPSTKNSNYWTVEPKNKWVSIADLNHMGNINNSDKYITDKAVEDVFKGEIVPENTLLMSFKLSIGKVSILKTPAFHNEAIISIFPSKFIEQAYLMYLLPKFSKLGDFKNAIKGNTLNQDSIAQILIPLPPLEEQRLIVAKVDELMELCDQLEKQQNLSSQAHDQLVEILLNALTTSADFEDFQKNWQKISDNFDLLFTTEYSIEQLKQTILQLAVMGKLVKQDPNDESVSELLNQFTEEKNKLIKEGTIKKSKLLSEISDEEKPFDLPNNWIWARLDSLTSKIGAGSTPKGGKEVYVDSGIPFLRSQNVWNEGLILDEVAFISENIHKRMAGTHVQANDLLFNITGGSIGRCALVPYNFETANVSQHVTIVRSLHKDLASFLHLVLRSSYIQKLVMDVQVGVSREGLSIGKLSQFLIPLPSLSEQKRIIEKVEILNSIIDSLRESLNKLQETKLSLADSLVNNALSTVNDNNELITQNNIVQFKKPIESVKESKQKSTDQIDLFTNESVDDDLKLLSLAAEITFQLHTEPTFGHLKLQKLVYLCQQLKHMDLAADFKQHVAGPYDPVMARYLDKEFKNREWFSYDPKRDLKYKPLSRCNDHRTVFNKYFAKDMPEIYDLIGLFRTSKSDHIEIVATLFACWLRLLEKKLSVTEEQLLKDFYAWSEEKKRFSKAEVLTGYKWMHQYSVIPQL
ncbi:restriction endonuclease subunit S [Acinetobacter baumannii]|nr:restriction endonuclease subunit S [Acinetobacter baumannii]MDC5466163.1 restriction endonuclease subunit S [Acinetobacter baumannii]